MIRCVALLAALLTALPALAQNLRNFPANALRAELSVEQPPDLRLNGQPARLSPGARIRGDNNLLMVSGALAGRSWVVNYTRDGSGAVVDVWVLTAAERAVQPWPTTAEQAAGWAFDVSAQRWSKP